MFLAESGRFRTYVASLHSSKHGHHQIHYFQVRWRSGKRRLSNVDVCLADWRVT